MKTFKFLICLPFFIFYFNLANLFGQLQNGSFEDWLLTSDNKEYPVYWDMYTHNSSHSVKKSNRAAEGEYALWMASLNLLEGGYAPSNIQSKLKPDNYNINFSFQYLIDSIEDQCHAVVEFYQRNNKGEYSLITRNKYNSISSTFTKETFNVTLPNLDTVLLVFLAENKEAPFGFDGFISVLYDDAKIEYITDVKRIPVQNCDINISYDQGTILLNGDCQNFTSFQVHNLSGQLITSGKVSNLQIHFENKGLFLLTLFDDYFNFQTMKFTSF